MSRHTRCEWLAERRPNQWQVLYAKPFGTVTWAKGIGPDARDGTDAVTSPLPEALRRCESSQCRDAACARSGRRLAALGVPRPVTASHPCDAE